MTSFKLTDIAGVVPEKTSVEGYDHCCHWFCLGCFSQGKNEMIDQLSQVELELDEGILQELIEKNRPTMMPWNANLLAKAIAAQLPNLITVKGKV